MGGSVRDDILEHFHVLNVLADRIEKCHALPTLTIASDRNSDSYYDDVRRA